MINTLVYSLFMQDSKFKTYSYIFPLILVAGLCLISLTFLNFFESTWTFTNIFAGLAYLSFTALWFGSIPYLLFLIVVYSAKIKLNSTYSNLLHVFSPLLFTLIFALFWFCAYLITNRPPIGILAYIEIWLYPVSLGVAIGGYVYFSVIRLIYFLLNRNNKLKRI